MSESIESSMKVRIVLDRQRRQRRRRQRRQRYLKSFRTVNIVVSPSHTWNWYLSVVTILLSGTPLGRGGRRFVGGGPQRVAPYGGRRKEALPGVNHRLNIGCVVHLCQKVRSPGAALHGSAGQHLPPVVKKISSHLNTHTAENLKIILRTA